MFLLRFFPKSVVLILMNSCEILAFDDGMMPNCVCEFVVFQHMADGLGGGFGVWVYHSV